MSRYHSYINTSLSLIRSYKGEMPFSVFIKKFFLQEKKFGSKDRKQIASLCYSYFRVALALKKQLTEENLLQAFFLTNTMPSELLQALKPGWNMVIDKPVEEKIAALDQFSIADIFPFKNELNDEIEFDLFCRSFLKQPDLFVRIRPQSKKIVTGKIKKSGIEHLFINDNCVQFPAATNMENILEEDKEVVIQDYNSQRVLDYLINHKEETGDLSPAPLSVWDCCAASGGKSILVSDLVSQKINLTVSDIRKSAILNLHQRFKKASLKNYKYFIGDISAKELRFPGLYDIIICDAPCTGSGTWSRTPEQLYVFDPNSINQYAEKQKKIASNVLLHLNNNGLFFYITCSVFKKENEEIVDYITQQQNLQLLETKKLYGYKMKADSMFVAVFRKIT